MKRERAYLEARNHNGDTHRYVAIIANIRKNGFGHNDLPHTASLKETSNDCPIDISAESKRHSCQDEEKSRRK